MTAHCSFSVKKKNENWCKIDNVMFLWVINESISALNNLISWNCFLGIEID